MGEHIKPFLFEASVDSLNLIRREYFERLWPKKMFHLLFYQNELHKFSPDYNELLTIVEEAHLYTEYKADVRIEIPVTKTDINKSDRDQYTISPPNHTFYMRYLANLQMPDRKIISLREKVGSAEEDCFLYRIKTRSGALFIVWESIAPNRATHIFKTNSLKEKDVLKKVKTHIIRTDITNRRRILNLKTDEAVEFRKFVNHSYIIWHRAKWEFQSYLAHLLKTN